MDVKQINEELSKILNENIDDIISGLDGAEIEAIFRKHLKNKPEYIKTSALLDSSIKNNDDNDYDVDYEKAEQIMIEAIKKYISPEDLQIIVDECDY